ncbi:hypothetical protein J7F01_35055 [Streptomyces sp. ISL-22]|uniref:hypothetical protein n=1 Tax=unclassified Streptomyces TaxID=2593676 RepID=UPI001BE56283|nr:MULTISPECIES: hypothetical protein [unclassified Streptomyces]MBT2421878.1 hypothetical protein [Streptomyces sp. ISL-24]MBT2437284.1 hypothetical protein [Streptomyces sp. ISL-22]
MTNRPHSDTRRPEQTRGDGSALLGIYLNDHSADATAGAERARHMVHSGRGWPLTAAMGPIAAFTTAEAEGVVGHPVRRRIAMTLMLLGNTGASQPSPSRRETPWTLRMAPTHETRCLSSLRGQRGHQQAHSPTAESPVGAGHSQESTRR